MRAEPARITNLYLKRHPNGCDGPRLESRLMHAIDVTTINPMADEVQGFGAVSKDLLHRAGGAMTLDAAAKRLGTTPEQVRLCIRCGTLLGMTGLDGDVVVPAFQIEEASDRPRVICGIDSAIQPFLETGEGGWAALQWLLDDDPNLGPCTPLQALRDGRLDDVARAARAYVR
ncbi:MAG: hypothetical protein K2X49_19600 [Acetobacteraceae bacterium]|nr:hypothetical protein [Acetobacteraceae bacterium]